MIGKLIAWLVELLRPKPKKQRRLEEKLSKLENKLKEIENEDTDIDSAIDRINK